MRSHTFAICYAPCSTGMREAVERIVDGSKNPKASVWARYSSQGEREAIAIAPGGSGWILTTVGL